MPTRAIRADRAWFGSPPFALGQDAVLRSRIYLFCTTMRSNYPAAGGDFFARCTAMYGLAGARSASYKSASQAIQPSALARATAWVRRSTPSLTLIRRAWVFTVCSEMYNCSATCWLE